MMILVQLFYLCIGLYCKVDGSLAGHGDFNCMSQTDDFFSDAMRSLRPIGVSMPEILPGPTSNVEDCRAECLNRDLQNPCLAFVHDPIQPTCRLYFNDTIGEFVSQYAMYATETLYWRKRCDLQDQCIKSLTGDFSSARRHSERTLYMSDVTAEQCRVDCLQRSYHGCYSFEFNTSSLVGVGGNTPGDCYLFSSEVMYSNTPDAGLASNYTVQFIRNQCGCLGTLSTSFNTKPTMPLGTFQNVANYVECANQCSQNCAGYTFNDTTKNCFTYPMEAKFDNLVSEEGTNLYIWNMSQCYSGEFPTGFSGPRHFEYPKEDAEDGGDELIFEYFLYDDTSSWDDAVQACLRHGNFSIASFHSQHELDHIVSEMNKRYNGTSEALHFWIGSSTTHVWQDGSNFDYSGPPNSNTSLETSQCLLWDFTNNIWTPKTCTQQNRVICKTFSRYFDMLNEPINGLMGFGIIDHGMDWYSAREMCVSFDDNGSDLTLDLLAFTGHGSIARVEAAWTNLSTLHNVSQLIQSKSHFGKFWVGMYRTASHSLRWWYDGSETFGRGDSLDTTGITRSCVYFNFLDGKLYNNEPCLTKLGFVCAGVRSGDVIGDACFDWYAKPLQNTGIDNPSAYSLRSFSNVEFPGMCKMNCSQDSECTAFDYSRDAKVCFLYGASLTSAAQVKTYGITYYEKCIIPRLIGQKLEDDYTLINTLSGANIPPLGTDASVFMYITFLSKQQSTYYGAKDFCKTFRVDLNLELLNFSTPDEMNTARSKVDSSFTEPLPHVWWLGLGSSSSDCRYWNTTDNSVRNVACSSGVKAIACKSDIMFIYGEASDQINMFFIFDATNNTASRAKCPPGLQPLFGVATISQEYFLKRAHASLAEKASNKPSSYWIGGYYSNAGESAGECLYYNFSRNSIGYMGCENNLPRICANGSITERDASSQSYSGSENPLVVSETDSGGIPSRGTDILMAGQTIRPEAEVNMDRLISKLVGPEILVNKPMYSEEERKKMKAPKESPAAKPIGFTYILAMCISLGVVVASDLRKLLRHCGWGYQNVKRFWNNRVSSCDK